MPYETKQLKLTLEIDIRVGGNPELIQRIDPSVIAKMLSRDTWCDGRLAYQHELMRDGLEREINLALQQSVEESFKQELGDKEVVVEKTEYGQSTQALYRKRAGEFWKEQSPYLMTEKPFNVTKAELLEETEQ